MKRIPSYETAPYRTELEVEVVGVRREGDRTFAVLDDTILYPEGGGQPCDFGWLKGLRINDVRKRKGEIRHYFDEGELTVGRGLLQLDWERRFDHMQQHTAQHLLSALALDLFGWQTRAFHLGEDTSDIDLDIAAPRSEDVRTLEDAVALQVAAAKRIRTHRVDPEEYRSLEVRSRGLPAGHVGDIRLVEIDGVDLNTCGGTHVGLTSEVGGVKILSSEPQRGGTRLYWVAGARLRRRLAQHEARGAELRAVLDTGDAELVDVCRLKLEQLTQARRRCRLVEERLAQELVGRLLDCSDDMVDYHLAGVEAGLLRPISEELAKRAGERVGFLTCEGEGRFKFSLVQGEGSGLELSRAGARVCEILGGRGGGSGRLFQGNADSLSRRAEAIEFLKQALRPES
jgi:Ser-tRNA(Ala) deacylase AlaX